MQPDVDSPEAQLVAYCNEPPPGHIISGQPGGRYILRLSESVVIKVGYGVTATEAKNQMCAHRLVDPSIVRIPKVLRFFESKQEDLRVGYLLMEYAGGDIFQELSPGQIDTIHQIVSHMFSIHGSGPASLTGSRLQGLLFSEAYDLQVGSIEALNKWVNRRCKDTKVDFARCELVLCHLDIAPRNLIWPRSGAPWLLDWEAAGFVPRLFEFCSHSIMGSDVAFHEGLVA
jgi:Phosphotransferase enzyme family